MRTGGVSGLTLAGAAVVLLAACGHASVVKDRFAAEYGCGRVEVQNLSGTTYVARGCGESATYTCATNRNGIGVDSVCVREAPVRVSAPPVQQRSVERDERSAGQVARIYNEERKLHLVRADFQLLRGVRVALLGAPEAELGDILVQVDAPSYAVRDARCGALEILVNGAPASGTRFAAANSPHRVSIQAHFQFEQFRPLAQSYPTFGARLCAQKLELSETEVAQLQKFLVIYSEMATEVQRQRQAQDAAQAPAADTQPAASPVSL